MDRFHAAIEREAAKLIRRHERYAQTLAEDLVRRSRRSTSAFSKHVKRPYYWNLDDGFNPYIVRARATRIAHSIRRSVSNRTYRPRNPIERSVPKDDGTPRFVSVFQVADSAISRLFYLSLMKRNRAKLSARSYAFRGDLTIHDAIQYLQAELDRQSRIYVAEFDLANYFGTISHDHIRRVLHNERFLVTPEERHTIEGFLRVLPSRGAPYNKEDDRQTRTGVPLGTALSLFLANVAAWPLDRRLERLGVGYVRYADDTLMWSKDYGQLAAAVDTLAEEARNIGTGFNLEKSNGIRILADDRASTEIESTSTFTFVGHKFAYKQALGDLIVVGLSDRRLGALKKKIDQLIYYNLLHEPQRGTQALSRLGSVDRDFIALIWQLRRLLYGRLSERQVRRALYGGIHGVRLSGILAYYPLVDAFADLERLDAWMATRCWLAMRKRAQLLSGSGAPLPLPPPHGLSREGTIRFTYRSRSTGGVLDGRIPSAQRMGRLVRMAATIHGPNTVGRIDLTQY